MNLMSIIVWILRKFDIRKRMSYSEVYEILSKICEEKLTVVDESYRLFSKAEIQVIYYTTFGLNIFIKNTFDCDDFASTIRNSMLKRVVGCPFGIAHIYGIVDYVDKTKPVSHALNIFISDKREVWLLEPQNGKIFEKPKDLKITMVLI